MSLPSPSVLGVPVANMAAGATPDRRKVLTYLTYGDRLLVLAHPDHANAGLQVPGGTVAPGEAWDVAARREATEETGLPNLPAGECLGVQW